MSHSELQIQVNHARACPGRCSGCGLEPDERGLEAPSMSDGILARVADRLVEFAAGKESLERVNVTFGVADHLLLPTRNVLAAYEVGRRVVEAGRPTDLRMSSVHFSTSLIGRRGEIVRRLEAIAEGVGTIPFVPLAALDARLIVASKFGPAWKGLVLEAKRILGRADLATNLSVSAVEAMRPRDLVEFATANAFDALTVNWIPTLGNSARTIGGREDLRRLSDWLLELHDELGAAPEIECTLMPVVDRMLDVVGARGDEPSAIDIVRSTVPIGVSNIVDIDFDGSVLAKFEAVGDLAHSARNGLEPLGHVDDGPIEETVRRAMPRLISRIAGIVGRGACADCNHAAVCAGTGFHVATKLARAAGIDEDGGCPHVAAAVIGRLSKARAEGCARAA